jgi:type I restriction enzyme S subunit
MMPNGWKLGVISDLADTVMGYAFKSADFTKTGIPLLRMGNLYQNTLSFDRNPIYLPESFKDGYERFLVKPNDLVMSMTGTMGKRDYGFTVKIPTDAPYSLLNQRVIKFVPKHQSSSGFLLNLLRSEIILSRLYAIPGGTKQANLSAKQIQELPAPIPPLPEQSKIAKILSTWDKAISTTERLINNSKQQKKALMQQLLTGKKRLLDDSGKPFEGEWVIKKLSDLFTFSTASSKSKFIDNEGENYILDMGSVSISGKLIPTKKTKISKDFLSKGQLVMPKDDIGGGQIIGRVGYVDNPEKYVLSDHVYCLTPKSDCSLFLSYLINHHDVNKGLRRRANGTAQLGLGKKDAEKQPVFMPKDITEQQKIASVLINADQEIELLEQQLADLKQEKKALMQQLLTGKRRVKVDDKEVA